MGEEKLSPQELCMLLNEQTFMGLTFSSALPFDSAWTYDNIIIVKKDGGIVAKIKRQSYVANPEWVLESYRDIRAYSNHVCDMGKFRLDAPGLAAKLLNVIEGEMDGILKGSADASLGSQLANQLKKELASMYRVDSSCITISDKRVECAKVYVETRSFRNEIKLQAMNRGKKRVLLYRNKKVVVDVKDINVLKKLVTSIEKMEVKLAAKFNQGELK